VLPGVQETLDVRVELVRGLKEGEVADVGLYQEAGPGRPVGHRAGLIVGDHFVVVGVDDPGWHGDLGEIGFGLVRLRGPHVGYLADEPLRASVCAGSYQKTFRATAAERLYLLGR
jgi:hypothetical protein